MYFFLEEEKNKVLLYFLRAPRGFFRRKISKLSFHEETREKNIFVYASSSIKASEAAMYAMYATIRIRSESNRHLLP